MELYRDRSVSGTVWGEANPRTVDRAIFVLFVLQLKYRFIFSNIDNREIH